MQEHHLLRLLDSALEIFVDLNLISELVSLGTVQGLRFCILLLNLGLTILHPLPALENTVCRKSPLDSLSNTLQLN